MKYAGQYGFAKKRLAAQRDGSLLQRARRRAIGRRERRNVALTPSSAWLAKGPRDLTARIVHLERVDGATAIVRIPSPSGWPFPIHLRIPVAWLQRPVGKPEAQPLQTDRIVEGTKNRVNSRKMGGRSGKTDLRTGKPL
jgi:hypothetical protein